MGLWLQAQSHTVTIRVQMPNPAMEAVVEVEGQIHAMEAGLWGARQATLELDGDFAYRFGTPAGPLGLAWENALGTCAGSGYRNATATGDMALAVVCFNGMYTGKPNLLSEKLAGRQSARSLLN